MVEYVILRHICEVCGLERELTPDAAYEAGWDYPPKMGTFGVVSPRTCPNCRTDHTLWWAIAMERYTADMLTARQKETLTRISGEPESIAVP